jgi:dolichyl-phosphate beta-glucosyltransferase
MPPALSIILPTYQGAALLEKHLPALSEYLRSLPITTEVIIVDDGSQDKSLSNQLAEKYGCKYLQNDANQGKGAAVRKGMLAAQGEVHLFTDSDIPYVLENIHDLYDAIHMQENHLAVGDRTMAGSDYHSRVPGVRGLGSRFFTFLVSLFLMGETFDSQCGIKAFSKEASMEMFSVSRIDRFAFDAELLFIALKRGYAIEKVPVKLRIWEPSGINILKDGAQMLVDLFRIRINDLRGLYSSHAS